MKMTRKALLTLGMALAGSQLAAWAPAAAQVAKGIAVANPAAVVVGSNAFKTADQQRQTTYKAQFDRATTRKTQIEGQLRPLATKLQTDAQASKPNQAALQQQYNQIQQIESAGQQEINQIMAPVAQSQAYVLEQIQDKLGQATERAMARQNITLLLDSQAVIDANQAYNLNQAILNELNALIPSAQVVPPQGWVPRAQRQQQAAAQPATGAPAAPTQAPAGR